MGKKHYNTTNNTPVATPGQNGVPYFGDYTKQGKVMNYRPAGYFRQGDAFVQTNKDGTHMYWSPSRQEYYRLTPTNAKKPTTSELTQGIGQAVGQAVGQVFSSFGTNKSPNVTPAAPPRQHPSSAQTTGKPSQQPSSPQPSSPQAAAQPQQQATTNADAGNVFIYLNDGSNRRFKLSEKEFNQKSYNLARKYPNATVNMSRRNEQGNWEETTVPVSAIEEAAKQGYSFARTPHGQNPNLAKQQNQALGNTQRPQSSSRRSNTPQASPGKSSQQAEALPQQGTASPYDYFAELQKWQQATTGTYQPGKGFVFPDIKQAVVERAERVINRQPGYGLQNPVNAAATILGENPKKVNPMTRQAAASVYETYVAEQQADAAARQQVAGWSGEIANDVNAVLEQGKRAYRQQLESDNSMLNWGRGNAGIANIGAAASTITPEALMTRLGSSMQDNAKRYIDAHRNDIISEAEKWGKDPERYLQENVLPNLFSQAQNQMYNTLVEQRIPKNAATRMIDDAVNSSIIASLAYFAGSTKMERQIRAQASQDPRGYQPNMMQRVGGFALGMAMDAPLLKGASVASGTILKATGLTSRAAMAGATARIANGGVAQRIFNARTAAAIAQGGLTLGQYETGSYVASSLATEQEMTLSGALGQFGHGFAMGASLGATGTLWNAVTSNVGRGFSNSFGQLAKNVGKRAAVKAGGLGVETATFVGMDWLSGKFPEGPTMADTMEAALTVVALKLTNFHGDNIPKRPNEPRRTPIQQMQMWTRPTMEQMLAFTPEVRTEIEQSAGSQGFFNYVDDVLRTVDKADKAGVNWKDVSTELGKRYDQLAGELSWDAQEAINTYLFGVRNTYRPRMARLELRGNTAYEVAADGTVLSKFTSNDRTERKDWMLRKHNERQRDFVRDVYRMAQNNSFNDLIALDENSEEFGELAETFMYEYELSGAKVPKSTKEYIAQMRDPNSKIGKAFQQWLAEYSGEGIVEALRNIGVDAKEFTRLMQTDVLELSHEDWAKLREIEKALYPFAYREGVNPALAKLRGEEMAIEDEAGIVETTPDGDIVPAVDNTPLLQAEQAYQEWRAQNEEIAQQIDQQMSKPDAQLYDVYDFLIEQGYRSDELQGLADYINAITEHEAYVQQAQDNAEQQIKMRLANMIYSGADGSKDKVHIVVRTNPDGATEMFYVAVGEFTTDNEGNVRANDTTGIILHSEDGTVIPSDGKNIRLVETISAEEAEQRLRNPIDNAPRNEDNIPSGDNLPIGDNSPVGDNTPAKTGEIPPADGDNNPPAEQSKPEDNVTVEDNIPEEDEPYQNGDVVLDANNHRWQITVNAQTGEKFATPLEPDHKGRPSRRLDPYKRKPLDKWLEEDAPKYDENGEPINEKDTSPQPASPQPASPQPPSPHPASPQAEALPQQPPSSQAAAQPQQPPTGSKPKGKPKPKLTPEQRAEINRRNLEAARMKRQQQQRENERKEIQEADRDTVTKKILDALKNPQKMWRIIQDRFAGNEEALAVFDDFGTEWTGDLFEFVCNNLPYRSLAWEDSGTGAATRRGVESSLFGKKDGSRSFTSGDAKGFNAYLAKKGEGVSVDQMAHDIWEELPDHVRDNISDMDVRDTLIQVLMSASKPTDISQYSIRTRLERAFELEERSRRDEEEYPYTPQNVEEQKVADQVATQLNAEIAEQQERVTKARSALEKATAKQSGKRDMFGEDDAATPVGSLFKASEMGYDNSDEGIRKRTEAQRNALAEEQRKLDNLQSDTERISRLRGALETFRNQTQLDFGKDNEPKDNEPKDNEPKDNTPKTEGIDSKPDDSGTPFDDPLENSGANDDPLGPAPTDAPVPFHKKSSSPRRSPQPPSPQSTSQQPPSPQSASPQAEAAPQHHPASQQAEAAPRQNRPIRRALRRTLEHILKRKGLLGDWKEGQRLLDADKKRRARMMGSRTENRKAHIASELQGKGMTDEQRSIADVFTGRTNRTRLQLVRKNGLSIGIELQQGNENSAGTKHSIHRHYTTKSGFYTAEEILFIPDIIKNGKRQETTFGNGKKGFVYQTEEDSVRYTVLTEVRGGKEVFNDFYTNRKNTSNDDVNAQGDTDLTARSSESVHDAKLQKVSKKNNEQTEKIFSAAKKKFGTTHDIREAGYILPDGTMLDFSGRHELDEGTDGTFLNGQRSTDHREISKIAYARDAEGNEVETGITTTMPDFIERGAIRIDANSGAINLNGKPTDAQRKALQRLIQRNSGDVTVDYGNGWDSEHYAEYEGANTRRVLADIDRYYDEGIKAEGNIKYFRTPSGEAYGFTLNGKIYIDPRIAEADTPIHEYAHLWAEALRISNAKEWGRIRDIILKQFRGTDLFNDVLKDYAELQNDPDRLAEEILAHFSGAQGQQRLLDAANRVDPALPDLRARAIAAVRDTQRAINDFWQRIAQFFGIKDKTPEQIADSILRDLLNPKHSLSFSAGRGSASARQNVPTRDTFYSNAERAVENISQKKATAEQWLAMIQKNGGLKAGEDKWLGLSEWLNERKGQSITKDEVLQFIRENQIHVRDVTYSNGEYFAADDIITSDAYLYNTEDLFKEDEEGYMYVDREMFQRLAKENDDFRQGFSIGYWGDTLEIEDPVSAARYLGLTKDKPINDIRLEYTTTGLDNYREIALTVPTIEPYKENDLVHFGDAGKGRTVAWVRFGDTITPDGKRVLVIDEIQSNRHQDGRKYGYSGYSGVPAAPFEKNWHELAMKRMLRYAAENGYDEIAWTKGAQQNNRYNIGNVVSEIHVEKSYDSISGDRIKDEYNVMLKDPEGNFILNIDGAVGVMDKAQIIEVYGKELGRRMIDECEKAGDTGAILNGSGLDLGNDGMSGFYDQILPRFMDKYAKKWNTKTHDIDLSHLPDTELDAAGGKMHAVDITAEMRESVMQGQPMFHIIGEKGAENMDRTDETNRMYGKRMAERMEENGRGTELIKFATGWERGADGMWRFETDRDINLKVDVDKIDKSKTYKLYELVDEGEIFKAYPELKNVEVKFYSLPNETTLGTIYITRTRDTTEYVPAEHYVSQFSTFEKFQQHVLSVLNQYDNALRLLRSREQSPKNDNDIKIIQESRDKWARNLDPKVYDGWKKMTQNPDEVVGGTITVNLADKYKGALRGTLLHEVQHFIQHVEGFGTGGNLQSAKNDPEVNKAIREELQQLISDYRGHVEYDEHELGDTEALKHGAVFMGADLDTYRKIVEQDLKREQKYLEEAIKNLDDFEKGVISEDDAHDYYRRIAGEVEARNAETRMDMSPQQRRETTLERTEDVERPQQIVTGTGKTSSKQTAVQKAFSAGRGSASAQKTDAAQKNDQTRLRLPEELHDGQKIPIEETWMDKELNSKGENNGVPGYKAEGLNMEYTSKEQLLDAYRNKYPQAHIRLSEDGNSIEVVKADWRDKGNGEMIAADPEYVERKTRQATETISQEAKSLGLDVEIKTDSEGQDTTQAKALGYYNTKTGKITINLHNHVSLDGVRRTLLHEGVAHHGLRKLFGEHFDNFLDKVRKLGNDVVTEGVNRIMEKRARMGKPVNEREATEEYLASLAEDMNFNRNGTHLWARIGAYFKEMLREAGLNVKLSNNDLRHILWRSYHNLKEDAADPMRKAKEIAMEELWRDEKASDTDKLTPEEKEESGIRFSLVEDPEEIERLNKEKLAKGSPQPPSPQAEALPQHHPASPQAEAAPRQNPPQPQVKKAKNGASYLSHSSTDSMPEHLRTQVDEQHAKGRRVPGIYDPETGQVHIFEPDVTSDYDRERTIEHETVAHQGMRRMLGEKAYMKYLDRLYRSLSPEEVREVNEAMQQNGWDLSTAMDEWLADKAEQQTPKNLWDKVIGALQDVKHKFIPNYDDVRYMLWASRKGIRKGGYTTQERERFLKKAGLSEYEDDTRYSYADNPYESDANGDLPSDVPVSQRRALFRTKLKQGDYDDTVLGATQRIQYESNTTRNSFYRHEAMVDYLRSAKELMMALVGRKDENVVLDAHNFYRKAMYKASVVMTQQENFKRHHAEPMQKAVNKCVAVLSRGKGVLARASGKARKEAYEDVQAYAHKKSGLERNRVFHVRDLVEWGEKREINSKRSLRPGLAKQIYDSKCRGVKWKGMPEDDKKQLRKQFAQEAHQEWLDRLKTEWQQYKRQQYLALKGGRINLKQFLRNLDGFINQFDTTYDSTSKAADRSGLNQWVGGFDPNGYYDEAKVIDDVMNTEDLLGKKNVDNLWERINDITDFSLDNNYNSGLISKQMHDHVASMMEWYVPMRGFNEQTAEDVWGYLHFERSSPAKILVKKANGRLSLPDSPFAVMMQMADASINAGESNKVAQAFLRLVNATWKQNDPLRLVSKSKGWEVYKGVDTNGDEIWEADWAHTTPDMSGDDVAREVEAFNQRMLTLQQQGLARPFKGALNVPLKFERSMDKSQHAVPVVINGETTILYVNANPRAAQAVNGQLSPRDNNWLMRRWSAINRFRAATMTSWSPKFILGNTLRDRNFAGMNVYTREGLGGWLRQQGNTLLNLRRFAPQMFLGGGYWQKYRKGTLNMNVKSQRWFKEFIDNGGRTGFVNDKRIDDYKNALEKAATTSNAKKARELFWKATVGLMEEVNLYAESLSRFSAYCTARQRGKSVLQAITLAKDASTNFDRKGAGNQTAELTPGNTTAQVWGHTAEFMRHAWLFINPGIQSLSTLKHGFAEHPVRQAISCAMHFAYGMIWPTIAAMAVKNMFPGEEDDFATQYENLNEYERTTNMCLYMGNKKWLKMPLGIEPGVFFQLGQQYATSMGMYPELVSDRSPVLDYAAALSNLLPVDPLTANEFTVSGATVSVLSSTLVGPVAENMINKKWNGKPVTKQQMFWENKYAPKWARAFQTTDHWTTQICKFLSDNTNFDGSDPNVIGGAINLDPNQVSNIWKGYAAGVGTFFGDVATTAQSIGQGEKPHPYTFPVINRLVTSIGQDEQEIKTRGRFYKLREQVQNAEKELKDMKKAGDDKADAAHNAYYIDFENKWKAKIERWKEYDKEIKRLKKITNEPASPEEAAQAEKEINTLQEEFVVEFGNWRYYHQ